VDDPDLGLAENNLIHHDGNGVPCPHLAGEEPGEYHCMMHGYPWYKETPCCDFGQIEPHPETPCRMGKHVLGKR
jgi:hypothetical protein